ncbi:MAG: amino acid adenylation domain-containing protein, partial [Acidobacteria bacterium]|nr:amino acid adenylation domain-containing protein [Acidobacteriota bacterium]
MSRNPLFQIMFALQNAPTQDLALRGLNMTALDVGGGASRFDLEIHIWEEEDEGLGGFIVYSTDLFEEASIARLHAHYLRLLEGVAADPDARVSDLPLLTDAERHQILTEWSRQPVEYPHTPLVHQLFEGQAARTPEATAVVFGVDSLSYEELNQRADRVARRLRAEGVGPESLVGLLAERSIEVLVGLLGVLKAGAAYVPLDPSYPQEWRAFVMADAGMRVLLTQRRLADGPATQQARVVLLDADTDAPMAESEHGAAAGASGDNLAYVIYTSGSTGRPKGVCMTHAPLAALNLWQLATSAPAARTLQFTSLSFDVSLQEIFSTWCTGGTLVVVPEQTRPDPAGVWRLIGEQRVERLFLPFVFLQQLAESCDAGSPPPQSLREIITAGEQLQITPAVAALFERLPGCRLLNHYGPTETHICTAHELDGPPSGWPALPPIGRPTINARVYVLDRSLRPVPVGVTGDLYVGGTAQARGYLKRPSLTAEKFIPDPFSAEPGMRLYRTGDLARWLPDGSVEFLGRADSQVKIRGFRVEPGEIEAVLSTHPAVGQAVVTTGKGASGEVRLIAYVAGADSGASAGELKAFLRERLPQYMVPAVFVFLDALPLMPSGKVDRQHLPAPDGARPGAGAGYVAPRTAGEEAVAAIWREVLGVSEVGVHDNFF